MELLLELFLELFGEAIVQILMEAGLATAQEAAGRENRSPALATIGYLMFGAVLGGLSMLLLPTRLFGVSPATGISLVVSPLVMGIVMQLWGGLRRAQGHRTTNLATFHGGAAFALGVALVRFFWAR
jgi:hypothetical protein